ncbi:MAG: DUF2294 domain-containing protein [Gaiellaceae bacterium]|jgi:uncharacterized protein YbcI
MAVDSDERRQQSQALSNAMTRLHRDHYGRGPGVVRTVIGHDHAMCILEDIYTPVERTLLDGGETEAVRQTRLAFQRTMESRFVAAVEEILGRKVRAFLSQVSLEPDISVEVFVLERDNADPAPEGVA